MKQRICLFIFIVLFAACQPSPPSLTSTLPTPHLVIETLAPSPIPTKTFTPSPTPTIEELIFPYTIDGLRQHNFQSGKIHIRSTLYDENQFYASYLFIYPRVGLLI